MSRNNVRLGTLAAATFSRNAGAVLREVQVRQAFGDVPVVAGEFY